MVNLIQGVAVSNREGVYHARLRRLGTEGRRRILGRSFVRPRILRRNQKKLVLNSVLC